jgi:hypothetical protein
MFWKIALLFVVPVGLLAAQEQWVESYGVSSPYQPPRYLSGFGSAQSGEGDAVALAQERAVAALAAQIRLRVRSDSRIREVADQAHARTSMVNTIHTATDVELPRVRYLTEESRREVAALAWVEIDAVQALYADRARPLLEDLSRTLNDAEAALADGDLNRVQQLVDRAAGGTAELQEYEQIWLALERLQGVAVGGDGVARAFASGGTHYDELTPRLADVRRGVSQFTPGDLTGAAGHLARRIVEAGVTRASCTPLLFEDTDFSSAFGRRFADSLETAIDEARAGATAGAGESAAVIRGTYWRDNDRITVTVRARDAVTGTTLIAAETSFPRDTVPEEQVTPPNAEAARVAGAILHADAVVSGGIDVAIWTDRGGAEDVLVYEEGEPVQFYFRVNQPAFLRLTYVLATGEHVLLEEEFYIGSDRVNRLVALPYRFVVVPPYGVERLIVTASSTPPPPARTVPRRIDDQLYQVFSDTAAVVARTRGLVRETPPENADDPRVGEASIAITTTARER